MHLLDEPHAPIGLAPVAATAGILFNGYLWLRFVPRASRPTKGPVLTTSHGSPEIARKQEEAVRLSHLNAASPFGPEGQLSVSPGEGGELSLPDKQGALSPAQKAPAKKSL